MEISTEIEQRVYIKMRTALKIDARTIHQELLLIQPETAYSYSNVALWSSRFREGRASVKDDPRSGRPSTTTTKANIKRVEELVEEDRRISIRAIEALTSLNVFTIHAILHDHLEMRKRKSRWVPHELKPENKQKRLDFAKAMLEEFQSGRLRLDTIITGDECWFYHRKIKKAQSNASWRKLGEEPDSLVKRDRFEDKTLFCIFFRSTGVVQITYFERGVTIDNQRYINDCLSPMIQEVESERPGHGVRDMLLLHDNAKPHVHKNVRNFLQSKGLKEIDHPPYSPDLAPCDFWLFDYIKERLDDEESPETLATSIANILSSIPTSEYRKTFKKYIERLELCVLAEGDYFEHFMK
jgi:histone-lysine N-methyltransferase SETMAR